MAGERPPIDRRIDESRGRYDELECLSREYMCLGRRNDEAISRQLDHGLPLLSRIGHAARDDVHGTVCRQRCVVGPIGSNGAQVAWRSTLDGPIDGLRDPRAALDERMKPEQVAGIEIDPIRGNDDRIDMRLRLGVRTGSLRFSARGDQRPSCNERKQASLPSRFGSSSHTKLCCSNHRGNTLPQIAASRKP